jgi:hypothetical protein
LPPHDVTPHGNREIRGCGDTARLWHFDDAKMPDERSPHMPDLSVRELKVEMDGGFRDLRTEMDGSFRELKTDITRLDRRFHELKTEMDDRFSQLTTEMDGRFSQLKRDIDSRITEGEATTRRHFDIVAESLRAEIRLRLEGTDTRVDGHERRIQALEKRRR